MARSRRKREAGLWPDKLVLVDHSWVMDRSRHRTGPAMRLNFLPGLSTCGSHTRARSTALSPARFLMDFQPLIAARPACERHFDRTKAGHPADGGCRFLPDRIGSIAPFPPLPTGSRATDAGNLMPPWARTATVIVAGTAGPARGPASAMLNPASDECGPQRPKDRRRQSNCSGSGQR